MSKVMHLFHDAHFDLVSEDALGDRESLGVYRVEVTRSGETEERHKVVVDHPDNFTEVILPDGYEATAAALSHLVQTLSDRHSGDVKGVYCSDARLGARVAALLGVDVVTEPQV